MLYTSYIAKLDKLPKDMEKVLITRFAPKWLNLNSYENLWPMKEFAPSQDLLLEYKKNNNWEYYIKQFTYEMINKEDMKKKLQSLLKYLQLDKDVMLICFEKDYFHCHRYLLAQWFVCRDIKWKEW